MFYSLGLLDIAEIKPLQATSFDLKWRISYSMRDLIPTFKVIGLLLGICVTLSEILFRRLHPKVVVLKVGRLSIQFNEPKALKRKPNVRCKKQ